MRKDYWLSNLFRHQIAGIVATLADFGVLVILTEVFHIWYVFSTTLGAFAGTLINFFISSYWAFSGSKNSLRNQMFKYSIVSIGSLILNTSFVYLLTDWLLIDYKLSKLVTSIAIGWFYNFLLMRYFVFKK